MERVEQRGGEGRVMGGRVSSLPLRVEGASECPGHSADPDQWVPRCPGLPPQCYVVSLF